MTGPVRNASLIYSIWVPMGPNGSQWVPHSSTSPSEPHISGRSDRLGVRTANCLITAATAPTKVPETYMTFLASSLSSSLSSRSSNFSSRRLRPFSRLSDE